MRFNFNNELTPHKTTIRMLIHCPAIELGVITAERECSFSPIES